MCSRFSFLPDIAKLKSQFLLKNIPKLTAKYNLAPTHYVPAIRLPGRLDFLIWGLKVAKFADAVLLHNARLETLHEKKGFKPFLKSRCILIASGFYFWQKDKSNKSQPYYVKQENSNYFAFAGLCSTDSCLLITTEINSIRYPVTIDINNIHSWLDNKLSFNKVRSYLQDDLDKVYQLKTYAVSKSVNTVSFDEESCIKGL